jgi:hypothetical protein
LFRLNGRERSAVRFSGMLVLVSRIKISRFLPATLTATRMSPLSGVELRGFVQQADQHLLEAAVTPACGKTLC